MQAWMALVLGKHQNLTSMNLFPFTNDLRLAETHVALIPVEFAEHVISFSLLQRVSYSKRRTILLEVLVLLFFPSDSSVQR